MFFFLTHVFKISRCRMMQFFWNILFIFICEILCTRLFMFLLWTYFRIFYFYQAFQTVIDYIYNILSPWLPLHSYAFQIIFFGKEHSKNLSTKSLYKRSQMSVVMALIWTSQFSLLTGQEPVIIVIWQIFQIDKLYVISIYTIEAIILVAVLWYMSKFCQLMCAVLVRPSCGVFRWNKRPIHAFWKKVINMCSI